MEKLYTLQVNLSSNDIEEMIIQLDAIRDELSEGEEKKSATVGAISNDGVLNGKWSIDFKKVCEFCLGEGEVSTDEDDGEGHTMRGVGTETCVCQKE